MGATSAEVSHLLLEIGFVQWDCLEGERTEAGVFAPLSISLCSYGSLQLPVSSLPVPSGSSVFFVVALGTAHPW